MANSRYAVEWDPMVEVELEELRAFEARSIVARGRARRYE
jgi:hypothetical protein